jgi:hypothetical protein
MLIFDNESKPIILDTIYDPVISDHFWVLDLALRDFTMAPLNVLEETICPSVVLRVDGFDFVVPASWNILVVDQETTQLDTVELSEVAGREFRAFVYGPNSSATSSAIISVVDYYVEHANISPALNKHQMLCHPISAESWINISPTDVYTKYLKDVAIGDLIGF